MAGAALPASYPPSAHRTESMRRWLLSPAPSCPAAWRRRRRLLRRQSVCRRGWTGGLAQGLRAPRWARRGTGSGGVTACGLGQGRGSLLAGPHPPSNSLLLLTVQHRHQRVCPRDRGLLAQCRLHQLRCAAALLMSWSASGTNTCTRDPISHPAAHCSGRLHLPLLPRVQRQRLQLRPRAEPEDSTGNLQHPRAWAGGR